MAGARSETGKISPSKLCKRYSNILNLAYLQAIPLEGGGYRIPSKVFELIQTELDFNPPKERTKKKLEAETKRRYRQRQTYRFWKEALDVANIPTEPEAKEFLYRIFQKLDCSQHYGTMTHARYAMETLQLALDDAYGTDRTLLQHPVTTPKKANKKKSKKAKASSSSLISADDIVPF